MSSVHPSPAAIKLDPSPGSLLIGVILQAVFYGVLSSSAVSYFKRYRIQGGDTLWMKFMILLAWILCSFSLAVAVHAVYFVVIKNFGNPSGLEKYPWSVCLLIAVNAVVVLLVRVIFLHRLWRFFTAKGEFSNWYAALLLLTAILSLVDLSGSIAVAVKIFSWSSEEEREDIRAMFAVTFVPGIAADIFLVGLLCFSLHHSRTGFVRMDSTISALIFYFINTGLFPTIVASAGVIAFLASSRTLMFTAFDIQVSNLYLISLIASLNCREVVRVRIERPFTVDFSPLDACVTVPDEIPPAVRSDVDFDLDLGCGPSEVEVSASEKVLIFSNLWSRAGHEEEQDVSEMGLSGTMDPSPSRRESESSSIGGVVEICQY